MQERWRPEVGFADREASSSFSLPHTSEGGLTGETSFPPVHVVRGGTYDPLGPRLMGGPMPNTELAEELLQLEEADAWFEYLESTRGQTQTRYAEVEPWAWARLSQRLRAVRARRSRLRPAAA